MNIGEMEAQRFVDEYFGSQDFQYNHRIQLTPSSLKAIYKDMAFKLYWNAYNCGYDNAKNEIKSSASAE